MEDIVFSMFTTRILGTAVLSAVILLVLSSNILAEEIRWKPAKGWVNALVPQGRVGEEITLAAGGKTSYVIVVSAEPTTQEQKAAQDLSEWLGQMTGADFRIVRESGISSGGKFISIGKTKLLEAIEAVEKDADLAQDGYGIIQRGDNLFLIGGSRRGPINAVYALLEEDLGCRWYDRSSSSIPHTPDLKFCPISRTYAPVLDIRDPFYWDAWDADWSLRNRTNQPLVPVSEEWGGTTDYAWFGHTFEWLVPESEYMKDHPEYFSLVEGERKAKQLCLTNPDVIRISAERVKGFIRSKPDAELVSVSQNDRRSYCECPNCKALDDAEGTNAGQLIYFVNAVADAIKDEFPNIKVTTLAYMGTYMSPKTIKPRDNVLVQLCTDRHAWHYPFFTIYEAEKFQAAMKGWYKLGARTTIWDYTTNYHHYPIIMPNWQVVDANIKILIDHGATGIMLQGSYQSPGGESGPMKSWVWAKKLWDPSLDSKALLRDFVFGYYGESAEPMWDYTMLLWDTWEKNHAKPRQDNPMACGIRYYPDITFLKKDRFLNKALSIFEKAEKAAKTDVTRRRVRLAKFPVLYSLVAEDIGFVDYYDKFQPKIKAGTKDKTELLRTFEEFERIGKEAGVTHIREGKGDFDKQCVQWRQVLSSDLSNSTIIRLDTIWKFKPNPDGKESDDSWSAVELDDSSWSSIRMDDPYEKQGFKDYSGTSWYRQTAEVTEELSKYKHVYMWFDAVGDDAFVYINGRRVFEHSHESTLLPPMDIEQRPFYFDARHLLRFGKANTFAVKVNNLKAPGGIWKPVYFIGTGHDVLPERP